MGATRASEDGVRFNKPKTAMYFPIDRDLAKKLRAVASAHGSQQKLSLIFGLQERVSDETRKAG